MNDTTFARSCAHWSEAQRREMEAFYALAWVDYRHLARAVDWVQWLRERQTEVGDRSLRLLDVACGSGKFPAALLRDTALDTAALRPVDYALLDPAPFSVAEARQVLRPPFAPGEAYVCTLQALDCAPGAFDIVWATHALYAVPPAEIEQALARFVHALGGTGFIAHGCEAGHYLRFYRHYLAAFRPHDDLVPYTSAEQIVEALERLGARVHTRDIDYTNGAVDTQRQQVEGYLQRCVFDDGISLDAMLEVPATGDYLRGCLHEGEWRFRQRVKLIFIQPPQSRE